MAASPALPAGAAGDAPEQRRTLVVLVCAQILSGAGLAAGITVGALLAQEMLGSTSLAGVPSTLFTLGSALAAVFIGVASGRSGRRVGLAAGYAVGALGSLGVIVAAVTDSSLLLFASLFVYGAGSAANLQARYAGADLAAPPRRARALSTVLVATTVGRGRRSDPDRADRRHGRRRGAAPVGRSLRARDGRVLVRRAGSLDLPAT